MTRYRQAREAREKAIRQGFIVSPEQRPPEAPQRPPTRILRSNWQAYWLFLQNLTQFRVVEGIPTGLDYLKPFRQAEAAGIVGEAWDDWIMRTEILETAYISAVVDRANTTRGGR